MAAYTTRTDLESRISGNDLIPFLDDVGTGVETPGLLDIIISNISSDIDGFLASIYAVPFNPVPPFIHSAATILTCFELYRRRLTPDEQQRLNPFKQQAEMIWERLEKIGAGLLPLDQAVRRAFPPGTVTGRPTIYAGGFGPGGLATSM